MIKYDLTDKRFGRLVVKEYSHTENGYAYWICKCDCGKESCVIGTSLRNGNTRSCGCLRNDMNAQRGKARCIANWKVREQA